MKKITFYSLILVLLWSFKAPINAQEFTQNIRGTIVDKDTKIPLIGATIMLLDNKPAMGTTSDVDGYFKLTDIPVGRKNLRIEYLGYEPMTLTSILLTTGKELVLNVELVESAIQMEQVVVKAKLDKTKTLNEMATVSARSFSVEETSRYAGSYFDPARMAQNFAGVNVGSGDDLSNEIVVRGNSPRGVMWRLEGIEIPNPNHFGSAGNSGGGISMLSSSIISNSDFYTGAFPTEFGNALSGVFDLNMRNGNNEKREYSFMLGALGVEASAEGPFTPGKKSSYLINYRYSTLGILKAAGLSPVGDVLPDYQDLSFKFNLPTKHFGNFALFGLGGTNVAAFKPERDSSLWLDYYDREGFDEKQRIGTIGLSHRILLSDNSYLKTVVVASSTKSTEEVYFLNPLTNYGRDIEYVEKVQDDAYRISTLYNHKLNARNTIRAGVVLSHLAFDFTYDENTDDEGLIRYFDNQGNTNFFQSYLHWKWRANEKLTFNTGVHYSRMSLNGNDADRATFCNSMELEAQNDHKCFSRAAQ